MIILFAILAGVLYLIIQDQHDDAYWESRIEHYVRVSDSLKRKVNEIDRIAVVKDSMMLIYITSLDKTLKELNKESKKNLDTIHANNEKQEIIIAEYCRYMELELKQRPEGCN